MKKISYQSYNKFNIVHANLNFLKIMNLNKPVIILLNKPFGVLSQFTSDSTQKNLSDFVPIKNFYPAGRLDKDSEGLLILTNQGKIQSRISHPKYKLRKTYWVQVEGIIDQEAIVLLNKGVKLKDGLTKPAQVKKILAPNVWERFPPIRERKHIPTSWIELSISEGKNRQVRRMTAHVGFPTLRLIRSAIGPYSLSSSKLKPGEWKKVHYEFTH